MQKKKATTHFACFGTSFLILPKDHYVEFQKRLELIPNTGFRQHTNGQA